MKKLLTISIAAYNCEKYITEALDSLCVPEIIDCLEVFVIDDGGKDRTLELAEHYSERYPNSIFLVHKDNGGWGSTVNYSIEHATGKYFRLLDGDDYYDTDGLKALIDIIQKIDVDVIYSPYRRFDSDTGKTIEKFRSVKTDNNSTILSVGEETEGIKFVMHSSTFRTQLLKDREIHILEHCFYTDNEYVAKGMASAKTAYILEQELYQYRIGREGQSVDKKGLLKHYKDGYKVIDELVNYQKTNKEKINTELYSSYVYDAVLFMYNTLLLLRYKEEYREFDKKMESIHFTFHPIYENIRRSNYKLFYVISIIIENKDKWGKRIKRITNRNS